MSHDEARSRPTWSLEVSAAVKAHRESAEGRQIAEDPNAEGARRIVALVLPELVRQVPEEELRTQLMGLAEMLRRHALQVSLDLPDTLWLDITGIGHLHAPSEPDAEVPRNRASGSVALVGERILARELKELTRELGHQVQIAVASGPRVAQAVARYGRLDGDGIRVVSEEHTREAMAELPLLALLDLKRQVWFSKLGILTIQDLLLLPERSVSSRLGKEAPALLELARGRDPLPLEPCVFPRVLTEHTSWDDPTPGIEPLLFALRKMTSHLEARLVGRGEALTQLSLEIEHDRAICQHRGVFPQTWIQFELSSPLFKRFELERVVRSRLERTQLPAPAVSLTLRGEGLCPQTHQQLQLGSRATEENLERLPVLLSELEADVGVGNLGILATDDAHRPEERSHLRPLSEVMGGAPRPLSNPLDARRTKPQKGDWRTEEIPPLSDPLDRATRLLRHPVAIPVPLRVGEGFALGGSYYTIERLYFAERLDLIQWWTSESSSRDYLWAWLMSSHGGTEALIYVDRTSGRAFVQALAD